MFDIVTIGSATVDVFIKAKGELASFHKHVDLCYPLGSKILIDDIQIKTGGGGTNTAVAFSRLGLKTGWLGKLGTDNNSDLIRHELENEHVSILAKQGEGACGYSVILRGKRDRTILTHKGLSDQLAPRDVPNKTLNTRWLYASAMLGKSFDTLTRLIHRAKQKGIRYAFNPSLYMAKWGIRRLAPILDGCDVLILNKEEAAALLGRPNTITHMARSLAHHAKIAVITDGANGAWATDGQTSWHAKPLKVKVIETTGAGDAFASAFVAAIIRGKDIRTALKYGMAQSASVIQHVGAKDVLLRSRDINAEVRRRKLEVIEVPE